MNEPTNAAVLPGSAIEEWLGRLIEQAALIAPVSGHGGDVVFAGVSSPEQVLWRFENPLHPPKQFLLPQTDPIVSIRRLDGGHRIEPIHDDAPRILFNVRNCDVKGIEFLTRVHSADLRDDTYLRREVNTTVISLACNEPCVHCFCTCTDSGPFLREGYDLQLTDLGDSLLAEAGSDEGRRLLDESGDLFRPAGRGDLALREEIEVRARSLFGKYTCHFASAMRRISTGRVEDGLWERMSDWCLECGACNMVCPTCYCFSVKDRAENGGWERCRIWDSCQYPAFTLEASGHNPRERRKERIKRRFFHKVSAQYYVRDGAVGCVGCGRCIKVCLGTTDMPAVVAAVRKGAWNG